MILVRSAIFQALFYLWTVAAGMLFLPLLFGPRRAFVPAGRLWCRGVMWLLETAVGLTYRVEGAEHVPDGPVVFAFKHQSAWDTVAVPILVDDPAIAVKKELLPIPLFGWYLWKHGMIPIDRKAGSVALRRLVRKAEVALAAGRPAVLFPEGTRTAPGQTAPYHPGIAALYALLQVPVVPVALNSGMFWGRREFLKRPGCITVRFLPAIAPGLARSDFMDRLRDAIESAADDLVASTRRASRPQPAHAAGQAVDSSPQPPVNSVEN